MTLVSMEDPHRLTTNRVSMAAKRFILKLYERYTHLNDVLVCFTTYRKLDEVYSIRPICIQIHDKNDKVINLTYDDFKIDEINIRIGFMPKGSMHILTFQFGENDEYEGWYLRHYTDNKYYAIAKNMKDKWRPNYTHMNNELDISDFVAHHDDDNEN